MRLSVTTGRREKWRKKDKTQDRAPVDDRRMESFRASVEVLKPRSWECVRLSRSWNPVSVYRGPETQVLRAKYRGPETQVLRAKYRSPETQVLRAKCSNAGLQARADCVQLSRVPTSIYLTNLSCGKFSYFIFYENVVFYA